MSNSPAPHLLVAVDGSMQNRSVLDYILTLSPAIMDMRITLLNVLPQTPPYFADEAKTDSAMYMKVKRLTEANRKKGQAILDEAKAYLVRHKMSEDAIDTKTIPRRSGLAKDIINETEMGIYDALVVSRRGKTRAQELFMGSVTNQLIQHAGNVPLWINEGEPGPLRVMVAVDGSEASLRAVDHLGFILGRNPHITVDFVHVTPKLQSYCTIDFTESAPEDGLNALEDAFRREDSVCLDNFFQKALQTLAESGFDRDRLNIVQKETNLGVARTIVRTALDGGYGTVVLGRRGLGKSSFLGSVSDKVIRAMEDRAVWLVS